MKIGIFIALLVLAASTEVSGQRTSPKDRSSRPKNEDGATEQVQLDSKPITVVREETKPVTIVQDISRPVTVVREETKPVIVSQEISKPVTIVREETKPVTLVQDASRPVTVIREETKPLIVSQEVSKPVTVVHEDTRPMTVVQEVSKPITGRRGDSRPVKVVHDNETPVDVEHNHEDELQPVDQASESHSQPEWDDARPQKQQTIQKTTRQPKKIVENVRLDNRPTGNRKPVARPTQETESEREDITPEPANEDLEHDDDDETNPKKLIVEGVSRERLPSQRLVSDVRIQTLLHPCSSLSLSLGNSLGSIGIGKQRSCQRQHQSRQIPSMEHRLRSVRHQGWTSNQRRRLVEQTSSTSRSRCHRCSQPCHSLRLHHEDHRPQGRLR